MQRVLIIHPITKYKESNLYKGVSQFAHPLTRMGYRVKLVTYENQENKNLNPKNVDFKRVKQRGFKSKLIEPIKEIIKGNEEIVFSQFITRSNIVWSAIAKMVGKRFILKTDYTTADQKTINLIKLKANLYLLCLTVDLFTSETPEALKELKNINECLRDKILFLPTGKEIKNENFYDKKFKIKEKKNKILYVGNLTYEKGVDILIDAFNLVKKDHPSWELELVGEGPIEKGNFDNERINFGGYLKGEGLFKKYKEAKIFCLPSKHESFSHVLIEAALTENAIISTRVGIANYLLKDVGLFFNRGDVCDLARKLEYYIENEKSRRKAGKILSNRALEFDIDMITKALISNMDF